MRKMRKINGYLVVRFNDRERRDYETLGAYGVIDAELYTGHLDVDRGALEYRHRRRRERGRAGAPGGRRGRRRGAGLRPDGSNRLKVKEELIP